MCIVKSASAAQCDSEAARYRHAHLDIAAPIPLTEWCAAAESALLVTPPVWSPAWKPT